MASTEQLPQVLLEGLLTRAQAHRRGGGVAHARYFDYCDTLALGDATHASE